MNRASASALGRNRRLGVLALGAAAVFAALVGPAAAADRAAPPAVEIFGLPSCTDSGVLADIRDRFAYGAARVEGRSLALGEITAIREIRAGVEAPSPIARRWCSAAVTLSDGTRSTLSYRVERSTGFAAPALAGLPWGLEFCVAGHDPWRVHDGACRTARRYW